MNNHQNTGDIEMDNNEDEIDDNSDIEEYDGCDEAEMVEFDGRNTLQRLKENDSNVTHLSLSLSASGQNYLNYFNDIDWKVDGDCISNNTHLKKLRVFGRILADHKHRQQQLEDFFSCLHQTTQLKSS